MEFKFSTAFESDLVEAFEYWKAGQINQNEDAAKKIQTITLDQWVTSILATPIYQLLKEKRTQIS